MKFANRVRRTAAAVAAVAMVAVASPSFAQEISEAHMKAARAAVDAINATDFYDDILPNAAAALKRELIQKNPDLTPDITAIVDAKALELAGRRTDLEKESAMAYARVLSEEDLNAIAAFYTSPAGLNLLKDGPIVTREVAKAAEIWKNGIARDLAEQVGKQLEEKVGPPKQAAPVTVDPSAAGAQAPTEAAPAN
ncbi:DUF2059 domain-containing protein [Arvimicrobium flavum]|uniref:DUF2059 domain-containing protein n=1 Tax=Arvimicrobium flavum TaxID=3393320 RepID=UPI00237BBB2E|nr:DUF2059 domain-containing protein [Mesorhizobium shangrilense]